MIPRSPLDLIRGDVNRFGELHLDKEKTTALLNWLAVCEKYNEDTEALVRELRRALAPLTGEQDDSANRNY